MIPLPPPLSQCNPHLNPLARVQLLSQKVLEWELHFPRTTTDTEKCLSNCCYALHLHRHSVDNGFTASTYCEPVVLLLLLYSAIHLLGHKLLACTNTVILHYRGYKRNLQSHIKRYSQYYSQFSTYLSQKFVASDTLHTQSMGLYHIWILFLFLVADQNIMDGCRRSSIWEDYPFCSIVQNYCIGNNPSDPYNNWRTYLSCPFFMFSFWVQTRNRRIKPMFHFLAIHSLCSPF